MQHLIRQSLLGIILLLFICAVALPGIALGDDSQSGVGTICSGTGSNWGWGDLGECLFRWFSVYAGSFFISVTAWFLTLSGNLLNYVIDTTVISFNSSIFTAVNQPGSPVSLNVIWAVSRDFANIGILGALTFIAISIILGKVTFNNKRLVAHVLVAALLINFSLVFSRVVVQTSGLFACQFYKAIVNKASCESAVGSGAAISAASFTVAEDGVSGSFLRIVGVGGFSKTESMLTKISDEKDGGGIAVLIHGAFTSLFLFIAVIAFVSMAVLLIFRAVMLLLLMSLSPLAFAAYAVPQWSEKFGVWWEALIRHSFFAPLLLALLWISSAFGQAITSGNGVLGEVLSNPAGSSSMRVVFLYLFVMSLLLASIYLSYRFAKTLSGARFGAMVGTLPIVGASLGAAAGLRRTVGRAGNLEQMRLEKELAFEKSQGRFEKAQTIQEKLSKVKGKSGREYNFMNTKPMQNLTNFAGLKGTWSGQTKGGGYAGRVDAKAKEVSADMKNLRLTDKDKKAGTEAVQKERLDNSPDLKEKKQQLAQAHEVLEQQKEATKAVREGAERQLEFAKETAQQERKQIQAAVPEMIEKAQAHNADGLKAVEKAIKEVTDKHAGGAMPEDAKSELNDKMAKRAEIIRERDNKIREAHQEINRRMSSADAPVDLARKNLELVSRPVVDAQKAVEQHERDIESLSKTIKNLAASDAKTVFESYNTALKEKISSSTSSAVADKVNKLWGEADKSSKLKDKLAAFGDELKEITPPPVDKKAT